MNEHRPAVVVPCNGCTKCCHNDAVRLLARENADEYETEPVQGHPGVRMLAHKPNGDCVYLTADGCSIHDRRPQLCRDMDCREIARRLSFTQARKADRQHIVRIAVWRQGRDLLSKKKTGATVRTVAPMDDET